MSGLYEMRELPKEGEPLEVAYEKPEVIMGKIEELEDQIKINISELKGMLKQA